MLRRALVVVLVVLGLPSGLFAQATHISTGGTLPHDCRIGDVYYKTGSSAGLYNCTASNTWTLVAAGTVGNNFFAVSGPATSTKTFTFPNANATVLTDNALVTVAQGGHGSAPASDDQVFVSSSTTTGAWKSLTDCAGANQAVSYAASSNTWGCTSITGGGGGGVGTVTTTGSPANGDIAKFSGATSITTATTTGSGSVVLATAPTMTLANATGLPCASGITTPYGCQLSQIVTSGSQATVDFSSISSAYSSLKIVYFSQDTQAGTGTTQVRIRLNNDSTAANYTSTQRTGAANTVGSNTQTASSTGGVYICNQPQSGNTNITATGEITLMGYAGTTFHKIIDARWESDSTGNGLLIFVGMARWKSAAAINQVTFTTDGTAFTDGSTFTLYGVK